MLISTDSTAILIYAYQKWEITCWLLGSYRFPHFKWYNHAERLILEGSLQGEDLSLGVFTSITVVGAGKFSKFMLQCWPSDRASWPICCFELHAVPNLLELTQVEASSLPQNWQHFTAVPTHCWHFWSMDFQVSPEISTVFFPSTNAAWFDNNFLHYFNFPAFFAFYRM